MAKNHSTKNKQSKTDVFKVAANRAKKSKRVKSTVNFKKVIGSFSPSLVSKKPYITFI